MNRDQREIETLRAETDATLADIMQTLKANETSPQQAAGYLKDGGDILSR